MLNKIQYFIIGRFTEGSKYGIVSKQAVEGYKIDEVAAVRKVDGKQGAYWVVDSFQTGIAIVTTGCKTRKAAVENYENNWKERVAAVLTEDRLKKYMEDLHAAPAENELRQYEEVEFCSANGRKFNKIQYNANMHKCIVKDITDESYINGGHVFIYGTPAMLEEIRAMIKEWEKEAMKAAEEQKANAAEQAATAADPVQDNTLEKEIDVSKLTAENIADYLPALLMSLANDKHNSSIILAAGIEAGAINPVALLDYFQTGRMPAVHTFDVWQKAGYSVRKGEKHAFEARIWKYTEKKSGTYTEEEAAAINSMVVNADGSDMVQAGDEKTSRDFIKKTAYFFTSDQVEKTPEPAPLPDLPEDVKKETRGGCEWISGNTRPIKESLKAAGFRWSKKNAAWYRREAA